MNKQEAKREAASVVATMIGRELSAGLVSSMDDLSDADKAKVSLALEQLQMALINTSLRQRKRGRRKPPKLNPVEIKVLTAQIFDNGHLTVWCRRVKTADRLVEEGYLEKLPYGYYRLTKTGEKARNQILAGMIYR